MNTDEMGVLVQHSRVKVVECSLSGLRLEMDRPIAVGTIARLLVEFGDHKREDTIQILRCVPVNGAGTLHQAGARFLSPLTELRSLRYLLRTRLDPVPGCQEAPGR